MRHKKGEKSKGDEWERLEKGNRGSRCQCLSPTGVVKGPSDSTIEALYRVHNLTSGLFHNTCAWVHAGIGNPHHPQETDQLALTSNLHALLGSAVEMEWLVDGEPSANDSGEAGASERELGGIIEGNI